MPTILAISLSVHWTAVFAFNALAAAPAGAGALVAGAVVLAVGNALVAALFFWTAVAAWSGDRADEVAGSALAVAAPVLAAGFMLEGGNGAAAAMQLAALGVTWLVIRAQAREDGEPAAIDWSGETARRLAVSAAHGSMLARLSRREPLEGDC